MPDPADKEREENHKRIRGHTTLVEASIEDLYNELCERAPAVAMTIAVPDGNKSTVETRFYKAGNRYTVIGMLTAFLDDQRKSLRLEKPLDADPDSEDNHE